MRAAEKRVASGPGRSTLAVDVAERLRQDITSGRRPPGSKLSEPTLAVRYGVSRAPVREALRQLEREGIVVFDRVGRSRVVTMTATDVQDISVIRVTLESAAAAEAARRFSEPLRAALEANIASMGDARSLADVTRLDLDFHASVMDASERRPLIAAWRGIRSPLALWLSSLHRTREAIASDVLGETIDSHRRLIDVLAAGDPERAAAVFSDHAAGLIRWLNDMGQRIL